MNYFFIKLDNLTLIFCRHLHWKVVNYFWFMGDSLTLICNRHLDWTFMSFLSLSLLWCLVCFLIAIFISPRVWMIMCRCNCNYFISQTLVKAWRLLKYSFLWQAFWILRAMLPASANVDANWFGPDHIWWKLLPKTLLIRWLLLYFYGTLCGAASLTYKFPMLIPYAKNNIGTLGHPWPFKNLWINILFACIVSQRIRFALLALLLFPRMPDDLTHFLPWF